MEEGEGARIRSGRTIRRLIYSRKSSFSNWELNISCVQYTCTYSMLSNLPHEARYILSYETGKDAYRRINYIQDKLAPPLQPPTNDMRGIPSPLGGCPTKHSQIPHFSSNHDIIKIRRFGYAE